jgi:DNA-binding transcriptional LysR family regulator
MTISLELIQILDAIERNGSFEAAANELNKVRSALTYTIRTYEQLSGIMVYDRSKYRAELTSAGKLLLEQGRELLFYSQNLEQKLKNLSLGYEPILRIAYDEVLSVKPLLKLIDTFQKQFPGTRIEVFSEVMDGCSSALRQNYVDIAIGVTGRLLNPQDFTFELLGKIKFVFAIAPDHPLAKMQEPVAYSAIKGFSTIFARNSAERFSTQKTLFSESKNVTFSSLELKKQAQIAGLGVGFLPFNLIKQELKDGALITKNVEKQKPDTLFYIGYSNREQGLAAKWWLNQLRDPKIKKSLIT